VTDSVEASLESDLAGHPNADPTVVALTKRIVLIARSYERAAREVAARHGVSLADAEVLFAIAHGGDRALTPGELAKQFQITAGSVTARLDRLERAGYLERSVDPANRVHVRLDISKSGDELHRLLVDDLNDLRNDMFADALSETKLNQLNGLLRTVLTRIEA
jgi:DNA-binding MarR family transcriptional regulator